MCDEGEPACDAMCHTVQRSQIKHVKIQQKRNPLPVLSGENINQQNISELFGLGFKELKYYAILHRPEDLHKHTLAQTPTLSHTILSVLRLAGNQTALKEKFLRLPS